MTDATYLKPLPEPSPDTQPYWEGLHQGKLRLQACNDCGKVRHYPRPVCPYCHSMAVKWVDSKGTGQVHSWTVAHHAFHPGFKGELPYTLVTVELDEGVRVQAQLRGTEASALKLGLSVKIAFEIATAELTLPVVVLA